MTARRSDDDILDRLVIALRLTRGSSYEQWAEVLLPVVRNLMESDYERGYDDGWAEGRRDGWAEGSGDV